jgi:hypothetical protein
MENDLLDDGVIEIKSKSDYPFFILVIGFLNIVLTVAAYLLVDSKISNLENSIMIFTSEAFLAFFQGITWAGLMLVYDIFQAFLVAIKERALWKWVEHVCLWLGISSIVIFFMSILILILRGVFLALVFVVGSLLQPNFELEGIALSVPYLLGTIVFTTGILCYYNKKN